MRYIVTVVAALIVSTTCHAQGRSIFIHNGGTHSCGKYLAAVQGHAPGAGIVRGQFSDDHFLYMAWLGGFFSAMNVWMMDERNEIKSDNAAIDVWIRKLDFAVSISRFTKSMATLDVDLRRIPDRAGAYGAVGYRTKLSARLDRTNLAVHSHNPSCLLAVKG